jgi:hypothetical protein
VLTSAPEYGVHQLFNAEGHRPRVSGQRGHSEFCRDWYQGRTCFWVAAHFDKVFTIEIDPETSKTTAAKANCPKNIQFFIGNSRDVLPGIVRKLEGRSLFWLDGHWCNVTDYGKDTECPLLGELQALADLKDARDSDRRRQDVFRAAPSSP